MSATGWWAEVFLVVRPNPATVHVTGGSPTLLSGKRILAAAAALTITGSAPTVVLTQHRLIQPSPAVLTIVGSRPVNGTSARPTTGSLTVTGGTPAILLSDNKTVQPSSAVVAVTASAPTVSATANQFPAPDDMALTITGGTPVVTASDLKLIRPTAASLTVSGGIPTAGVGLTFVPSGLSLTATMSTPTVTATANKFITPANAALTVAGGQPVALTPRLVTPSGVSLTVTGGTPTVTIASVGAHYTDLFNRSNSSTLGVSWNTDTSFTSLTISGNAAIQGAGNGGNIYTSPMLTGNNQITLVMKGIGTPTTCAVNVVTRLNNAAGINSASAYVELSMTQGGKWGLYRNAADGTGVQTAGNESWADGDTIVFTCVGSTLTVKRNGSTVLTTSAATDLAAGYVELLVLGGAGSGIDSFDAQDI